MIPASCAVASASPFGSSRSRRAVSGAIRTVARRDRAPPRQRLAADVDHANRAGLVDMREVAHRRADSLARAVEVARSCASIHAADVVLAHVRADRLEPRAAAPSSGISSAAVDRLGLARDVERVDASAPSRRAPRARRRSRRGRATPSRSLTSGASFATRLSPSKIAFTSSTSNCLYAATDRGKSSLDRGGRSAASRRARSGR